MWFRRNVCMLPEMLLQKDEALQGDKRVFKCFVSSWRIAGVGLLECAAFLSSGRRWSVTVHAGGHRRGALSATGTGCSNLRNWRRGPGPPARFPHPWEPPISPTRRWWPHRPGRNPVETLRQGLGPPRRTPPAPVLPHAHIAGARPPPPSLGRTPPNHLGHLAVVVVAIDLIFVLLLKGPRGEALTTDPWNLGHLTDLLGSGDHSLNFHLFLENHQGRKRLGNWCLRKNFLNSFFLMGGRGRLREMGMRFGGANTATHLEF